MQSGCWQKIGYREPCKRLVLWKLVRLLHPEPAAAGGEKTSREDAGILSGKSESVTPLLLFQTFKKYEICILSPRGLAQ